MKSDALLAQLDQSKLKPARLREQRASVTRQLLKRSEVLKAEAFKHIETRDLAILFDVVDREYFDGNCTQVINDLDATLSFRLSKRMTSCGGTTTLEYESNPQQSGETKSSRSPWQQLCCLTHFACENRPRWAGSIATIP